MQRWRYSNGVTISHSVRQSTTIRISLYPRISTTESLVRRGAALDVQVNGDYNSGVINSVGFIAIIGYVTGRGFHHFANASGAGG